MLNIPTMLDLTAGVATRSAIMLKVMWVAPSVDSLEESHDSLLVPDDCWIRINRNTTSMNEVSDAFKKYFNIRPSLWWPWSDRVRDVSFKTAGELGYDDGTLISVSVVEANVDLTAGRATRSSMMLEVRWEGRKAFGWDDVDRHAVFYDVCWFRINRKTTTMKEVEEAFKMHCGIRRTQWFIPYLCWDWKVRMWDDGSQKTAESLMYDNWHVITVSIDDFWNND